MSRIKIISTLAVALVAIAVSMPAFAHGWHHHHHHRHVSVGVAFGPVWYPRWYYPPPYYYYPPYYPQVVGPAPTAYIERHAPAEQSPGSQGYWYYCKESKAYHPYVKHCPGGWEKQTPAAPPPGG